MPFPPRAGINSGVIIDVRDFNGRPGAGRDNSDPIRRARYQQQLIGGELFFAAGIWEHDGTALRAAPQTGDATVDLVIRGAGRYATTLRQMAAPANNAGIGYVTGVRNARMDIAHLTIDGNYSGVDGGIIPQTASTGLLAGEVPWELPDGNNAAPNGVMSSIRDVRFYRAPGFTCQPSKSLALIDVEFDSVGQPDLASGATHYDTLGSGGYTELLCAYSQWHDSSGNYVDAIDTTGTKPIRVSLLYNRSKAHQIGGVYAFGLGSEVIGNVFEPHIVADGYVGYDSGSVGNRGRNVARLNVAPSLKFYTGADPGSDVYGDDVDNNFGIDNRDYDPLKTAATLIEFPRREDINLDASVALVSGTVLYRAVKLKIDTPVAGFRFRSGGTGLTAGATPHLWVALFDATRARLGQTPDDVAPVWAAATLKDFTFAAPIVITRSGLFWVGIMANVTTPPTLSGNTTATNLTLGATPIAGTNATDVGLTTTAPNPMTAIATGVGCLPYLAVL